MRFQCWTSACFYEQNYRKSWLSEVLSRVLFCSELHYYHKCTITNVAMVNISGLELSTNSPVTTI